MRILSRLVAVYQTRGARGFARFVASRIFSHRHDIVFAATLTSGEDEIRWDGFGTIICISRENVDRDLSPHLAAQLSQGEGAEYLEGLRGEDLLLAVVDEAGDILHHSFILFATRTKALLDEGPETPLFAHCATRPWARGRRLYPQTLRYGLGILAQKGHRRAIINCDPSNRASVNGIVRAGFEMIREIRTFILGSWLGLQTGRDSHGRRLARIYIG